MHWRTILPTAVGQLTWSDCNDCDSCAAIVGPQGSGKTTLLHELARRLTELPKRMVLGRASTNRRENQRQIHLWQRTTTPGDVVLVDSAEQLARIDWRRLVRQTAFAGVGLIVTTHRRCRLPTWIRCQTSWPLMQSLLAELCLATDDESLRSAAQYAFRQSRGNIRDAFRRLYDEFTEGHLALNER